MTAAQELSRKVGVRMRPVRRWGFRRRRSIVAGSPSSASRPSSEQRASSPRALAPKELQPVHETLNSDRFVDQAPTEVYATLLDEGQYLCSVRTSEFRCWRVRAAHDDGAQGRGQALGVSPATFYRRRQSFSASKPSSEHRASSPRALAPKERQTVHDTLNSAIRGRPPRSTRVDEGQYLCRCAPCIASGACRAASGAISSATQTTKSRSFWRREPTRFGPGTSRSFSVP